MAEVYEDELLAEVLAERSLAPFAPSNESIAFVDVVGHDVFRKSDPYPVWLNYLHYRTTEKTVRRELLFDVGDNYGPNLAESARNLRGLGIFNIVRITPARRGDDTGVLVFVRDLWSLRLEQGFQITGGQVDRLLLQLTERNLFGRNQVASARFQMAPRTFSFGQKYADRRFFGHVALFESADIILEDSGKPEGVIGRASLGSPLYDFAKPFGWDITASVEARPIRQLQGSDVLTYDVPETPAAEEIERTWDQRRLLGQARLRWQVGSSVFVHRLAVGVGMALSDVKARTDLGDSAAAFRRDVLPVARNEVFPFFAYQGFAPHFQRFLNLDTYGITEAIRMGPSFAFAIGGGSKTFFSQQDFVFVRASAGVARSFTGADLVEFAADASTRITSGALADSQVGARFRAATGASIIGRFTLRIDGTLRHADTQQTLVSLGGDSGLRGYKSQAFFGFGKSDVRTNLEWRGPPLLLSSIHIGPAAFYDTGDVFTDFGDIALKQSLGLGVRFLFPEFNRTPYRIDFAVPLDGDGFRIDFIIGDNPVVLHGHSAFDRLIPRP